MKNCTIKFPLPLRAEYPKTPGELDDASYKVMFTKKQPPTYVNPPRFEIIANGHIPLRRNSKLLVNERKKLKEMKETGGSLGSSVPEKLNVSDEAPEWAKNIIRINEKMRQLKGRTKC